jgi:hypothetical protein
MKLSARTRWMLKGIPLAAVGAFCMVALGMFVTGLLGCGRDLKSPQIVDVSPLVELTVPTDMTSLPQGAGIRRLVRWHRPVAQKETAEG